MLSTAKKKSKEEQLVELLEAAKFLKDCTIQYKGANQIVKSVQRLEKSMVVNIQTTKKTWTLAGPRELATFLDELSLEVNSPLVKYNQTKPTSIISPADPDSEVPIERMKGLLLQQMEALSSLEKPTKADMERAKAVSSTGQVLINAVKLELEVARFAGKK